MNLINVIVINLQNCRRIYNSLWIFMCCTLCNEKVDIIIHAYMYK